jgi:hypothetical protein
MYLKNSPGTKQNDENSEKKKGQRNDQLSMVPSLVWAVWFTASTSVHARADWFNTIQEIHHRFCLGQGSHLEVVICPGCKASFRDSFLVLINQDARQREMEWRA